MRQDAVLIANMRHMGTTRLDDRMQARIPQPPRIRMACRCRLEGSWVRSRSTKPSIRARYFRRFSVSETNLWLDERKYVGQAVW
jgi:hypothetical protein